MIRPAFEVVRVQPRPDGTVLVIFRGEPILAKGDVIEVNGEPCHVVVAAADDWCIVNGPLTPTTISSPPGSFYGDRP